MEGLKCHAYGNWKACAGWAIIGGTPSKLSSNFNLLSSDIHDKSMGGEGTETETRPGGDEWPGW